MAETEAYRPTGRTKTARLTLLYRPVVSFLLRSAAPAIRRRRCARGAGSLRMTMMAGPHSIGNTSSQTRRQVGVHVHTRDPKDQRGLHSAGCWRAGEIWVDKNILDTGIGIAGEWENQEK